MLSMNSLHVHGIVRNDEIELLANGHTESAGRCEGSGAFQTFRNTRHWPQGKHPGAQRVQCWATAGYLRFCSITALTDRISCWSGRRGLIFTPTPDNLWYCKVLLVSSINMWAYGVEICLEIFLGVESMHSTL
jgi:glycogen debranching enzyme